MGIFGRKKTALSEAARFFRARRFADTIRILEPQVFAYRENPSYYYMLGMACLYTGDYFGANTYLKRCLQIDYRQKNAQLGLAIICLKRNETHESLRIWLEILDDEPKNRFARLGLDTVKKNPSPQGIEALFENRRELSLVPSPGFFLPVWAKRLIAGALLVAFLGFGGVFLRQRFLPAGAAYTRPGVQAVYLDRGEEVLDKESRAVFMLTEQEIRSSFESVKSFLDRYEDNQARREINRLLLSNAGRGVKSKASAFIPFIQTPTFANFPDSFSFQEVRANPALHEGCFVRWKGRISNVVVEEKRITFDFLVGYADQKILEGIVPAELDFAARLEAAFAYEIIGRVVTAKSGGLALNILSLHELGL
ncbi:MAG: hypothetical protein LBC67_07495 [Spirochaetales bacterium]|jgi:tetratricopeptide (TPR) repeat protein|nr:hypothetical protein [Spirochaetales bacterium]